MAQELAPQPAAPTGAAVAPRSPRRRRWPWVLAAVALVLAGAAAAGFAPLVRWVVLREARAHGVALELGAVHVGWSRVELLGLGFEPIGIDGISGRVQGVTIELDGLTPQGIDARGIALDLVGSAPALALAVSGWAKDHPRLLKVPARASAVAVSWRAAARDEPWLVVRDATIEPVGPGGRFSAAGVHLLGKPIGQIGASWGGDTSTVTLGFGEADAERAPVRIDVRHAASEPEAVLILRPTALERLAGPLGVELPVKGVTASARAEMKFVGPGTKGAVVGKLTVELDGYRPPVPSELSALTFGSSTHFEAELEVSADRGRIDLRGVKVEHGAFRLAGQGAVTRQPDHALVSFALEGHLACADLARTIARSKIGGQTGRLAGIAAGLAVKGSVSIGVAIELDSRHFADAAVHPKIGIGCGLADFGSLTRDLHLPRLPSLGR